MGKITKIEKNTRARDWKEKLISIRKKLDDLNLNIAADIESMDLMTEHVYEMTEKAPESEREPSEYMYIIGALKDHANGLLDSFPFTELDEIIDSLGGKQEAKV